MSRYCLLISLNLTRRVQGMNEIIGPIYYVFASDQDEEWKEHAEADTFFCFQNLMTEIKDNFIRTLDTSDCGIGKPIVFEHILVHFLASSRQCHIPVFKKQRYVDSTTCSLKWTPSCTDTLSTRSP